MRIDLGNFGNNQRQAVSTQVNRGDVTALADAQINSARQQEQTAQQVGQAWGQVGQRLTQLGENIEQRQGELAQQKAALQIQQKQLFAQGVIQEATDKVDQGLLKADDVQRFYNDSMSKFKTEDISGLHGIAADKFAAGLQEVDQRMGADVTHLYNQAHKVETRSLVDEQASTNERLTLNGGDITKAEQLYDTPVFMNNLRVAYGAAAGQKLIELKGNLYKQSAMKGLLDNRDSYGGLQALQQQITQEGGKYYGKLDADAQLSVLGQIDSRKSNLEAKAEAAAARAEAQRQRDENRRMQAENKAQAATLNMREFIAQGNVPDPDTIDKYTQVTAGTSYATNAGQVMQLATATQQFSAQPLAAQRAQLDGMAQKMKEGTNPADVQVFKAMQNAYAAQKKALDDDPITAVANRSGTEIEQLPMQGVFSAQNPKDQKAANQAFASVLYTRDALRQQARQQSTDVPQVLLTQTEREQMKAEADKMPPNQRIQYYKQLANAGGKFGLQLVKEISGDDVTTAAAYHTAVNPNDNTGALIAQGAEIINDKKSGYSAPKAKETQAAIDDQLGDAVPGSQRSTLANSVNAHYVAKRIAKNENPAEYDDDDYRDSIKSVVGDVVQYGDSKVVVPKGTDSATFRNNVYNQIKTLQGGDQALALLEQGQARLQATGAKRYMLLNPNNAPYINPADGQPISIELP